MIIEIIKMDVRLKFRFNSNAQGINLQPFKLSLV